MNRLGKYDLLDLLGSGAYAEVYRARDAQLKRIVALKVLKPALIADEDAFQRFLLEAQAACDLFHPHIATVLDLGEAEGHVFLAMRFIDGPSLSRRLQDGGAIPWAEALEIILQVGEALAYAHARGLVHRDVKPSNILLGPEGAVLTDFGLVRAVEAGSSLTRTGSFIGTPQYMPPEVWQGKPAGPASDQYALACVLVEMLTGRVLFDGPTPPAVMLSHFQPVALPANWPEGIPSEFDKIIHKSLNQNPEERYSDIKEFIATLDSLFDLSRWSSPGKPDELELPIRNQNPASKPVEVPEIEGSKAEDEKNEAQKWFEQGEQFKTQNRFKEAIVSFTCAIDINPQDAKAYNERGYCYDSEGQYDQAISDFSCAIELDANYFEAYNNRGISYDNNGEYDNAIQDFTQAIELNPRDSDLFNNRGISYDNNGEYDFAINDYTKSIEINPLVAEVFNNRGISYDNNGEYDFAIADFTSAIDLHPKDADFYNSRGVCFDNKGEYDRAISDFTRSIELDSIDAIVYCNRGDSFNNNDEPDLAVADYTRAIVLDPTCARAYYARGVVYEALGDKAHAKADLAKAKQLGYRE